MRNPDATDPATDDGSGVGAHPATGGEAKPTRPVVLMRRPLKYDDVSRALVPMTDDELDAEGWTHDGTFWRNRVVL